MTSVVGHKQKTLEKRRQAGAELCQAQAQVRLPAMAELILTVEFHILADFQLFSSSFMVVVFHIITISKIMLSSTRVELQLFCSKFHSDYLSSTRIYLEMLYRKLFLFAVI